MALGGSRATGEAREGSDWDLALYYRDRAQRGDRIGALGQVAKAIIEEAHAILCSRREWVLNEKRIVARAGLGEMHQLLGAVPGERDGIGDWIASIGAALDSAT